MSADHEQPAYLAVGRIVGTHGVKGGLRVVLLTDFPALFRRRKRLFLGEELRPVEVVEARVQGDHAIVRLAEIPSPEEGATHRGALLYVAPADAARLRRGQHFWHEIIGLRVRCRDGRELGVVRDILRTGANDVYVVTGPLGDVLVPAIADVVRDIDVASGQITIEPLPGLLPGED